MSDIDPDPSVPGEWNWDKPSLAVVARGEDGCAVIYHVGPHTERMIEDLGLANEELFDKDPPLGITVFEGKLTGGNVRHTMDGPDYDDIYLSGEFRTPTDAEWLAIREGRCPWDPDDWLVPGAPV